MDDIPQTEPWALVSKSALLDEDARENAGWVLKQGKYLGGFMLRYIITSYSGSQVQVFVALGTLHMYGKG
jgi:hypothetical protein